MFHFFPSKRISYLVFLDNFNRFDLRFDEFLCNKFVLNASLAVLLRSGSFSDATKTKGVKKKKTQVKPDMMYEINDQSFYSRRKSSMGKNGLHDNNKTA